jgi:hypothetical protein
VSLDVQHSWLWLVDQLADFALLAPLALLAALEAGQKLGGGGRRGVGRKGHYREA